MEVIYEKDRHFDFGSIRDFSVLCMWENGNRAAGDVKFTMVVSILSTIVVRLLLSYLFGIVLDMGVMGIAVVMVCDWVIRAVIFVGRLKSGKWKEFQVIG